MIGSLACKRIGPHRERYQGLAGRLVMRVDVAGLDWATNTQRQAGRIPDDLAPIVERLQVRSEHWLDTVLQFDQRFGCVVGRAQEIMAVATRMGRRWMILGQLRE